MGGLIGRAARCLMVLIGVAGLTACASAPEPPALDAENTLVLSLEAGPVLIAMRPDLAPLHVERIKALVRAGAYDGLIFERGLPTFLVQIAPPEGGSGRSWPAEFSDLPFRRGTVGMARGPAPDSGRGAFFITLRDAPNLDGQFTAWGEVVQGMELVDRIRKSRTGPEGFILQEPAQPKPPRYVEVPAGAPKAGTPTLNPYALPPTRLVAAQVLADRPEGRDGMP